MRSLASRLCVIPLLLAALSAPMSAQADSPDAPLQLTPVTAPPAMPTIVDVRADVEAMLVAPAFVPALADLQGLDLSQTVAELRAIAVRDTSPALLEVRSMHEQPEHVMQFFEYQHLPSNLQMISKPFSELAHAIVEGDNGAATGNLTFGPPLPRNPERTVALRKLLEAKDAAVRAAIAKTG